MGQCAVLTDADDFEHGAGVGVLRVGFADGNVEVATQARESAA